MPTFDINLPDGRGFEVDAPSLEAAHKAFMQSGLAASKAADYVPPAPQGPPPGMDPNEDIKKLLPSLPGHVAAATFGAPGNLLDTIGLGGVVPTSEDWQKRLQDPAYGGVFGDNYQPQTTQGRYLKSIAENAVGAAIPGSLPLKIANVVLPGILGQAGEDVAGPGGRLAGSLIGGFGAGGLAGGIPAAQKVAALKATPTLSPEQLNAAGTAGKEAAKASGATFAPDSVKGFVAKARTALADADLSDSAAAGVYRELSKLEAGAAKASTAGPVKTNTIVSGPGFHIADDIPTAAPHTATDMVMFRGALSGLQKTAGPERAAAGIVKSEFDDFLKHTNPKFAQQVRDFTGNYRASFLGADIANAENRAMLGSAAANSGMNTENKLRQAFVKEVADYDKAKSLGRTPKYDATVVGLMRDLVTEGGGNAMRTAGNYLGGGGGAMAGIYGLAGAMHHPILATLPIIGAVIKSAGNARTLAKVDEIARQVARGAPAAKEQFAQIDAAITKAMDVVRKSQTTAAKKSAMLQSLQNLRPPNVAKAEEDK